MPQCGAAFPVVTVAMSNLERNFTMTKRRSVSGQKYFGKPVLAVRDHRVTSGLSGRIVRLLAPEKHEAFAAVSASQIALSKLFRMYQFWPA